MSEMQEYVLIQHEQDLIQHLSFFSYLQQTPRVQRRVDLQSAFREPNACVRRLTSVHRPSPSLTCPDETRLRRLRWSNIVSSLHGREETTS